VSDALDPLMELPDHPWFPNDVMEQDHALLDRLVEAEPGSVERLLFGRIPLRVFGDALTADVSTLPLPGLLWTMHLSGYFGGVWLRREIARAQPEAPLLGVDVTPDAEAFAALTDAQSEALDAARGHDAAALAFATARFDGHLDRYGYNRGYLTEILEAPPAGLAPPPGFLDAPGLLDARYSVDEIRGLDDLVERFALEITSDRIAVDDLSARQADAHARGRAVWSTGLSVQGFPQAEYEQLLELSAYFLQGTQAAGLAAIIATTSGDAALARRAAVVDALLEPWSVSYMMGLLDGRSDRRLPTIR
jgi:hypothetical protein